MARGMRRRFSVGLLRVTRVRVTRVRATKSQATSSGRTHTQSHCRLDAAASEARRKATRKCGAYCRLRSRCTVRPIQREVTALRTSLSARAQQRRRGDLAIAVVSTHAESVKSPRPTAGSSPSTRSGALKVVRGPRIWMACAAEAACPDGQATRRSSILHGSWHGALQRLAHEDPRACTAVEGTGDGGP